MRLRLGRIGSAESVCAAAICMCVNGVFDIDPEYAYSNGNSTYISLPISIMLSLGIYLLVCAAMERRSFNNLWQLIRFAVGRTLGKAIAMTLCAALAICASMPLANMINVLDELVYEGVEYTTLLLFIAPTVAYLAFKGLETVARTAKCFAVMLLLSLIAAAISSFSGMRLYRLYPVPGDGADHMLAFAFSHMFCFVAPLTALLIFGDGAHGTRFAEKSGIKAAVAACVVCAFVQLVLAFNFSYKGLSSLFMPLCRISYPGIERSYVMWLDKLLVMIWLNGCMISAAYCIYSGALLYSRAFSQRDILPSVAFQSVAALLLILPEYIAGLSAAQTIYRYTVRYAALLSVVPLIVCSALSAVRKRVPKEKKYA